MVGIEPEDLHDFAEHNEPDFDRSPVNDTMAWVCAINTAEWMRLVGKPVDYCSEFDKILQEAFK